MRLWQQAMRAGSRDIRLLVMKSGCVAIYDAHIIGRDWCSQVRLKNFLSVRGRRVAIGSMLLIDRLSRALNDWLQKK
jgi:hypothetical protein